MPLCFSIMPPPPISTLFPYTTLFRSGGGGRLRPGCAHEGTGRSREEAVRLPGLSPSLAAEPRGTDRDRKSTRLNSSHGYISYAVFCLKKKTILYRACSLQRRPCSAHV